MAKKVYAVRRGHETGIFSTWGECQKAVNGFSKAEYKSFPSMEEAEAYLDQEDKKEETPSKPSTTEETELDKENTVIAYVDGSYKKELNRYSYGLLLLLPDGKQIKDCGSDNKEEALESNNIAGELWGTMVAIDKAIDLEFDNIHIRHDYEGIAKWAKGEWRANKFVAKQYKEFIDKKKGKINISFEWVKGHSDDVYNDLVDSLAKKALNINQQPKTGDNYLVVDHIDLEEFKLILTIVQEDIKDISIQENEEKNSIRWVLKKDKEKLTIIYYQTTNKLMLQGKAETIFSVTQTYVLELVNSEQIHEVLTSYYNIDVDKETVENKYQFLLPNKNVVLSDKLENTLKQAVLNLQLQGDMYDFTYLVFPAFRGMEGFLKYVLDKHKINSDDSFRKAFEEKAGMKRTYCLKTTYHDKVGSPQKIKYVNKLYRYYKNNRDLIFHWDAYDQKNDTTRMVSEKSWRDTITDALDLIDEYFRVN
ncbi:viroplasmin family protein [Bacillus atrophaeus]|uniref:ribonuclease H1 domain-containing protein n=1 Tax=Bacillus atrophaeus TaxID=1452 RepID=UPI00227D9A1A|nr:viroplasmin family protein [Bacillus atrophaeus]MCY8950052.1 viroplasmin family protein [Bacillus atrophaeus]